jgi:hypothetical protein
VLLVPGRLRSEELELVDFVPGLFRAFDFEVDFVPGRLRPLFKFVLFSGVVDFVFFSVSFFTAFSVLFFKVCLLTLI